MATRRRPGRTTTTAMDPAETLDKTELDIDLLEDEIEHRENTQVQAHMGRALEPVEELPPGMEAKVEILEGAQPGQVFPLDKPKVTIGRGAENDIAVDHPAVSYTHAAIYFCTTREWRIRDLNSTNGTLLNGSRVTDFALRNGDKIIVGGYRVVFLVDQSE